MSRRGSRRVAGFDPGHGAGFIEQIDRAVGQAQVAQVAGREPRGGIDRLVGVADAVVFLVATLQAFEDADGLLDGGLVDRHLLQAPGERAVAFDVLELLECRRPDHAQLARNQHGLDQCRQVHGAAGRGTGAHGCVNLVDEQHRVGPPGERADDGFEPLLEVAAESGAGQQRRRIEREDLRTLERRWNLRLQQAQREALGHRCLAHTGLAHEHRIVLAAAAEDLDRPLQFLDAPDQRIELAGCGALAQVDRVRGERVSCRRTLLVVIALLAGMAQLARLVLVRHGHLADPVRDVVEDVEPGDTLRGEQLCRVGLLLLEHRGEDVPGPHFIASCALHVEDRRLQHAPEGERLLRLAAAAAAELLQGFREIRVEIDPELPQIHTDRGEDPFAFGIVREGVQEMLERQVRVPTRACLAVGDRENDFESGTEHKGTDALGFGVPAPAIVSSGRGVHPVNGCVRLPHTWGRDQTTPLRSPP